METMNDIRKRFDMTINFDYNKFAVDDFKSRVDDLVSPYKKEDDLEYLKQTLREIRAIVHQANLDVDQFIVNKQWESFDTTYYTDLLTSIFPNLTWGVKKSSYAKDLIVHWIGTFQDVEVELAYYNAHDTYSVSVNFEYKNEGTFSPYCESTYSTIEEAIQEIKDIIIPLQNTLSKLQIN